ncbi:bifunctional 4-hydroxy-2-oxoglutarate aldolase/2-dehydro-3-deoxy-phosphogluconate aldolase [Paenarthrobacter sp. A20]|uniref:bifunctional 4-hydroxy-2-oxoglutarate aldolase/2-dehydro-3-deoxy-phosphogluconate aldolase n=1 Tax=Paenarthrobacter sp. A20 TaxID=2817891 RepID=UPI00209E775A|nr:bifunctional 4-hydroxy-2-oxoglutarate aldolase/2-dehydro-3-deoxy-phosphogluconate aldolase [Paenarthrobacter sp. A20]MCP1415737.1 2-dehydro-3-deoxyphosphogluconate aldolase/(4S)-4-hydroxy-2-oxoglutarate aldolase [Paenarthrobacter sp. A20]
MDLSNDYFSARSSQVPLMAILRGFDLLRTVELSHRAWDLGMELVEVPIQNERAVEVLAAVVRAGRERGAEAGAGTVTSLERVREARDVGARFTVAPGFDPAVAQASLSEGLPHLPGVGSATDIHNALKLGLTWMKAFPAVQLGTGWIQAMQGPFPEARFVATGGITLENAEDFLGQGAGVVSLGSSFNDERQFEQLPDLISRLRPGTAAPSRAD